MSGKEKVSKVAKQARSKNIAQFNEDVAAGRRLPAALKHGGHSKIIKRQYSDLRYKKARQLKVITQTLADDLGGQDNLTAAQSLLLNNIRSKLIVLLQISEYVDIQDSIVDAKGELAPCLGKGYITYTESLRRDLEALCSMTNKKAPLSYKKALEALEGGKP